MEGIVTGFHVFVCVVLVLVVLVQSGRGADVSASFTGSSQSVFGASGGANFFTRFTAVTAALFMLTSIYLTYQGGKAQTSLLEGEKANTSTSAPVTKDQTKAPAAETNTKSEMNSKGGGETKAQNDAAMETKTAAEPKSDTKTDTSEE